MKNLKIFIVSMMVLFFSTAALAQRHRHTERTDSSEEIILKTQNIEVNLDKISRNLEDSANAWAEEVEAFADGIDDWAESFGSNKYNQKFNGEMGFFVWMIFLICGFFLVVCPLIFVGFIIWLLCRPSKKGKEKNEKSNVIHSDPDSVTIKAEARDEAIVKRQDYEKKENKKEGKSMMEQGIKKIAIGAGLFCAAYILKISLFSAFGVFIMIYGVGQLAIEKFTGKKDERP